MKANHSRGSLMQRWRTYTPSRACTSCVFPSRTQRCTSESDLKIQRIFHQSCHFFSTKDHLMDVTSQGLFQRLVVDRKGYGSYCFGHNGLFLDILRGLGYRWLTLSFLPSPKPLIMFLPQCVRWACAGEPNSPGKYGDFSYCILAYGIVCADPYLRWHPSRRRRLWCDGSSQTNTFTRRGSSCRCCSSRGTSYTKRPTPSHSSRANKRASTWLVVRISLWEISTRMACSLSILHCRDVHRRSRNAQLRP